MLDVARRKPPQWQGRTDLKNAPSSAKRPNSTPLASACRPRSILPGVCGRVLRVHGLSSTVQTDDGALHLCATRRVLKTLSTDQRHVVAAGDWVYFRTDRSGDGIIERVEPRRAVISRSSRRRQHVIVSNVDQIVIIGSAAEPYLKPNLIDRFLVTAEQQRILPSDLHQQGRSDRAGRFGAARGRVLPDGLSDTAHFVRGLD